MIQSLVQFLHLDRIGWRSLMDILVLTIIIYQLLRIFQGTRAFRMLSGILVLAMAYILTGPGRALSLPTVNRVLGALLLIATLAIVVLFQNHIRRMLAIALAVAAVALLSYMPADGYARGHVSGSGYGYHGGGGCGHADMAARGHEESADGTSRAAE